ncbi:hypothetical protein J6590_003038 [Homalodisca vitripennis]|nr:hypothetical protein J6590_003038 [Homalodisca vitripennis]
MRSRAPCSRPRPGVYNQKGTQGGNGPSSAKFCLSEFDERLTCSIRNLSTPHSVHNYTSLPFVISTFHLSSPCPLYSGRHRMLILLVNLAGERWIGITHPPLSRRLQRACPEQPSPAHTLSRSF